MITMEKVEKLRDYAGITYAEAKAVLEETDGDLLEAVVKLEKEGKVKSPESGGEYRSTSEQKEKKEKQSRNEKKEETPSFSERLGNILKWFGTVVEKGNKNYFKITRDDSKVLEIPLTAMALLLLFTFWFVIPVLVFGLLLGFRYSLSGSDLEKSRANKTIKNVSEATINAVDSMSNKANKADENEDSADQ
ncbi:MAG: DUF4342 domain-containing protein [Bacillota bacterium]